MPLLAIEPEVREYIQLDYNIWTGLLILKGELQHLLTYLIDNNNPELF